MTASKKKIAVITGASIIAAGGIGAAVAVSNHTNHSAAPSKNKKSKSVSNQKSMNAKLKKEHLKDLSKMPDYIAIKGDTISSLSKHFNVDPNDFMKKFNLKSSDSLVAGTKLKDQRATIDKINAEKSKAESSSQTSTAQPTDQAPAQPSTSYSAPTTNGSASPQQPYSAATPEQTTPTVTYQAPAPSYHAPAQPTPPAPQQSHTTPSNPAPAPRNPRNPSPSPSTPSKDPNSTNIGGASDIIGGM